MCDSRPHRTQLLADALLHLEAALRLLDEGSAQAEIGAYVDLAASKLSDLLGRERESAPPSRDPLN